jgi:hypothetical protein
VGYQVAGSTVGGRDPKTYLPAGYGYDLLTPTYIAHNQLPDGCANFVFLEVSANLVNLPLYPGPGTFGNLPPPPSGSWKEATVYVPCYFRDYGLNQQLKITLADAPYDNKEQNKLVLEEIIRQIERVDITVYNSGVGTAPATSPIADGDTHTRNHAEIYSTRTQMEQELGGYSTWTVNDSIQIVTGALDALEEIENDATAYRADTLHPTSAVTPHSNATGQYTKSTQ